jgi:NADH-quinone oxidoreductase subunit L
VGAHAIDPHATSDAAYAHAHDHGHGGGTPHDAPPAMAIVLVVLALGSVVAGYIGLPHAIGPNVLGEWLEPAFEAPAAEQRSAGLTTIGDCAPGVSVDTGAVGSGGLAAMSLGDCAPAADVARAVNASAPVAAALQTGREAEADLQAGTTRQAETGHVAQPGEGGENHDETALEWALMGVSTLIAFLGIGLATFIWLRRPEVAEQMAARFPGVYRVLLNKYYVDELYDVTVVQPVKIVSEDGLWRGMDARVIDGSVNATGQVVAAMSAVIRLVQSGSVKTYAASTLLGVVVILAYYLWR